MAYTKQQIIEAALLRFKEAGIDTNLTGLDDMFDQFYDKKGKETFRKYASVDAETMRKYFESIK